MKVILFVVPQLSHGGSNKSLESILSRLNTSLFDIKIVSLKTKEEKEPYYSVFRDKLIEKSYFYTLIEGTSVLRKVCNAINNFLKFDVWKYIYILETKLFQHRYHFATVIGFEESYATVFASYFEEVKKVAWMHCDYNLYKVYSGGRDEHELYSRFDHIAAVSQFAKEVFIENFPEAANKTSVIYNILDSEIINKQSEEDILDDKEHGNRAATDKLNDIHSGTTSEMDDNDVKNRFTYDEHQYFVLNSYLLIRQVMICDR